MRACEIIETAIGNPSPGRWHRLLRIALVVLACGALANGQNSTPDGSGTIPAETSIQSSPAPDPQASPEKTQGEAPKVPAVPGSILGTVLDQTGSVAVGAVVRLTSEDQSLSREVTTGDNGQFSFAKVPPGPFKLSVTAAGFTEQGFSGELASGQTYLVPPIAIAIETVRTDVKVTVDPVEVATIQEREAEQQRVFGFIPNFYVTYHPDAPPLTTKLKFRLAWKSSIDPITIVGVAFLAGMEQAGDEYPEFGQGALGYGKRFGAAYTDVFASTFLSGAIFPALLKQDPRYFYKGTGSTSSRILRAVGNSVTCRGDNGRWQINYANIAGTFAGAALSSTFYPTNNPGMFTLSNGFIRLGESSLGGVVQEFVLHRFTKTKQPVDHLNDSSGDPAFSSKKQ
ncbi:MAG TPA: carboxypeptidase-like regulatory domain-containing protein [Terriglobales bacterium]|nr:carboxypeptidase-like regulatory domain-containing protein [Terriglobales bacterium]